MTHMIFFITNLVNIALTVPLERAESELILGFACQN